MDVKEIRDLIDLVIEKDLAEFELEQHGISVKVRRLPRALPGGIVTAPASLPAGATLQAAVAAGGTAGAEAQAETSPYADGAHVIRSPMVGTFYRAPDPKAEPFVEIDDEVAEGQPLCIVEAMKLMNEINADVAGKVVAILVENAQPVEYGQELFAILPSS